jgi:hypothetical protein
MTDDLFAAEIVNIVEGQEGFEDYQNSKGIRDRDSITIRMGAYSKIVRLVDRSSFSTSEKSPNALIDNRSRQTFRGGCGTLRWWRSGIQHFRRKAGHGNDRVWKAWKAMMPASHPSHTLWKSLRDSLIPTASTPGYTSSHAPQVEPSPPQGACNGCLRSTA